jgi:hypothetical protein
LVAYICSKGNVVTSYRTPELTINFSEKDSLEDKIRKIIDGFQNNVGAFDYMKLSDEYIVQEDAYEG